MIDEAMPTRIMLAAVAIICSLAPPAPAGQPTDAAWFGEWTLRVDRSTFGAGSQPYRRGALTIEPWGNEVKMIYDLVRIRGGITHMEWIGQLDGKDYPVQGVEEFITYAYTRLDDATYQVVTKVDLAPIATSTVTFSPDGRTITTVTTGRNAQGQAITTTTVYEKQARTDSG